MLDIGWQELMLVCVVVVIVVGPKELPKAVRGVTGFMRKMRMLTNEFQNSLTDIADANDIVGLKKEIDDVRNNITLATADDPTGFGSKFKELEDDQKKIADDFNASTGKKVVKEKVVKKKVVKKTAKKSVVNER